MGNETDVVVTSGRDLAPVKAAMRARARTRSWS